MSTPLRHGVMFHHFHGGAHRPTQGSISAQDLERVIHHLGRENILSAEEWAEKALTRTLSAQEVCFTFDDNLRSQYDVAAPVLRRHGIRAFFFIYTSVLDGKPVKVELYRHYRETCFKSVDAFYQSFFATLDDKTLEGLSRFEPGKYLAAFPFYSSEDRRFRFVRDEILGPARYEAILDKMIEESGLSVESLFDSLWMDDECLKQLAREGHALGLHSHTHPTRLGELTASSQAREYETNFSRLKAVTGIAATAMSHPCNSYSTETLSLLKELGIRVGFCSNMKVYGDSELELPREDHANLMARLGAA